MGVAHGRPWFPRWKGLVLLVTTRGKSQTWGGITRDPYHHLRRKLAKQQQLRDKKFPLISEARQERRRDLPINVTSLVQVLPALIPLEPFARAPVYTRQAWVQKWLAFKEGMRTVYSGAIIKRKLKKIEPFKPIKFARWAQEQFIETNRALQVKDKHALRKLTTEDASLALGKDFAHKNLLWQYLDDVERPRVVSARTAPLGTTENLFGQVVVRTHTRQLEAVHDTAGRLVRGDPTKPRNVIDYIVFERHLTDEQSQWRICAKLPPQQSFHRQRNKITAPGFTQTQATIE